METEKTFFEGIKNSKRNQRERCTLLETNCKSMVACSFFASFEGDTGAAQELESRTIKDHQFLFFQVFSKSEKIKWLSGWSPHSIPKFIKGKQLSDNTRLPNFHPDHSQPTSLVIAIVEDSQPTSPLAGHAQLDQRRRRR